MLRHKSRSFFLGRTRLLLTLCLLGKFYAFFLSSADFFSKSTFSKNSFKNTIRVSTSLDPDPEQDPASCPVQSRSKLIAVNLGVGIASGNRIVIYRDFWVYIEI